MFPLTHIWFSEKVLGYANKLTILAAVFPDIVITKCLSYEQTHNAGWGLFDNIKKEHPDLMDFARSMVTHTVNPKGLDYYGDEVYQSGYKGYCFQKAVSIEKEVIDACYIPQEYGLWKAHNFIEMGIELNIVANHPKLPQKLHDSFCDKNLIREISKVLSKHYNISEAVLVKGFDRFSDFIEIINVNSSTLAAKYFIQMHEKHGIDIDTLKCTEIIEKARQIANKDFDSFIDFCIKMVEPIIK